jgi:trans-aconitate methyltransferase
MSLARATLCLEAMMTQTWDPQTYGKNASFVHEMAGGVIEWLAAQPGERILDMGCGDGQLTQKLIATGAKVRGVDASAQMAAAARRRGIDVDEANVEELPYEDASFDAVFSNATLHWVRNHNAMTREVKRVLRRGGRFVAEMGGHGNVAAILVGLRSVLERYGYGELENEVNYYPAPAPYTRCLEQAGFRVEKIALIPRPTPLASGMPEWLRTFRRGVLEKLPENLREVVVADTTTLLERALCDEEGNWTADYVRLRFVARA